MQMRVKYLFEHIPELISSPDNSVYDIRAAIDEPLRIPAYGKACVPTGIAVELSGVPGYANTVSAELQVRPRSGHTKQGLVAQFGTIDISYRGEISVSLFNCNSFEIEVQPLERIAQLVVCPIFKPAVVKVDRLTPTARGDKGFGSSGKG